MINDQNMWYADRSQGSPGGELRRHRTKVSERGAFNYDRTVRPIMTVTRTAHDNDATHLYV